MDELGELAIGLIIVVSLFGIVVPFLPGLALEVVAVVVWAALKGGAGSWSVAIAAIVLLQDRQVKSLYPPLGARRAMS